MAINMQRRIRRIPWLRVPYWPTVKGMYTIELLLRVNALRQRKSV